jgi:hypothetical protein
MLELEALKEVYIYTKENVSKRKIQGTYQANFLPH